MKSIKIILPAILIIVLGCVPLQNKKKPWLTHQIKHDYGRVCNEHFKPNFLKEKFIEKEIELFTHTKRPILFRVKFLVPSNAMLRVKPNLDKELDACELYLENEKIGWLFVDEAGCVEYSKIYKDRWKEWFAPDGIGKSLNEIYYSATGQNPSSLGIMEKEKSNPGKPLFSYETDYQWGTSISDIVRMSLRSDLKKAFEILRIGAPPYNNIVTDDGNIKINGRKKLKLQFILKDDPFLKAKPIKQQLNERRGSYKPLTFDANTIYLTGYKNKKIEIISSVILDKILWDWESGEWLAEERYIPRLAFALAHQIYGPLHESFKKTNSELSQKRRRRTLIREDVRAIKEGMAFLRRLMKSKEFKSFTPTMRDEFKRLLMEERKNFKSWAYMMKAQRKLKRMMKKNAS